jgi:hypothetical protein
MPMTRHTAAALLASMLTLAAPVTACSSSGSGNHASSAPSATPAVTTATESAADAFDACQDYSAQELLMEYAERDFVDALNSDSPDLDAKRAAFVAAATNAVQQVTAGIPDDVPDPPAGALRAWVDAERAFIAITGSQAGQVVDFDASEKARAAFNAGQLACKPVAAY